MKQMGYEDEVFHKDIAQVWRDVREEYKIDPFAEGDTEAKWGEYLDEKWSKAAEALGGTIDENGEIQMPERENEPFKNPREIMRDLDEEIAKSAKSFETKDFKYMDYVKQMERSKPDMVNDPDFG